MAEPKDLNNPSVYVEALVYAALVPQREVLAAWLADEVDAVAQGMTAYPFKQRYLYFADKLLDLAPVPELGFRPRPNKKTLAIPKIGRNDACPCGSGKKYKQCHLGGDEVIDWKLGSPTPAVRAMSVANLIRQLPIDVLDAVPRDKALPIALAEMADVYKGCGRLEEALPLIKTILDGDREDPFLLYDYWIARYAEWLVEVGRAMEGERFLKYEHDNPRQVQAWQVAQKLAAFYIDQGDFENALFWVDAALAGDPENPFNHYLKGMLAHFDGIWEVAIASYEEARNFSGRFREEEKAYMGRLVDEALKRAENHQPVEDDDDDDLEEGEEDLEKEGNWERRGGMGHE